MKEKTANKKTLIIAIIAVLIVAAITLSLTFTKQKGYLSIKIIELFGTVTYDRGNDKGVAVYDSFKPNSGDRMQTGQESYVRMSLDSDKYVFVEEKSDLAFESTKKGRILLNLHSGAIINEIESKLSDKESYEVKTPNALMAVRGTRFRVSAYRGADGIFYTRITGVEGSVECQVVFENGDKSEKTVITDAGNEALIYYDEVNNETDFVYFDDAGVPLPIGVLGNETREIKFEELPLQTLEYLVKRVDEGADINVPVSQINNIIENYVENDESNLTAKVEASEENTPSLNTNNQNTEELNTAPEVTEDNNTENTLDNGSDNRNPETNIENNVNTEQNTPTESESTPENTTEDSQDNTSENQTENKPDNTEENTSDKDNTEDNTNNTEDNTNNNEDNTTPNIPSYPTAPTIPNNPVGPDNNGDPGNGEDSGDNNNSNNNKDPDDTPEITVGSFDAIVSAIQGGKTTINISENATVNITSPLTIPHGATLDASKGNVTIDSDVTVSGKLDLGSQITTSHTITLDIGTNMSLPLPEVNCDEIILTKGSDGSVGKLIVGDFGTLNANVIVQDEGCSLDIKNYGSYKGDITLYAPNSLNVDNSSSVNIGGDLNIGSSVSMYRSEVHRDGYSLTVNNLNILKEGSFEVYGSLTVNETLTGANANNFSAKIADTGTGGKEDSSITFKNLTFTRDSQVNQKYTNTSGGIINDFAIQIFEKGNPEYDISGKICSPRDFNITLNPVPNASYFDMDSFTITSITCTRMRLGQ